MENKENVKILIHCTCEFDSIWSVICNGVRKHYAYIWIDNKTLTNDDDDDDDDNNDNTILCCCGEYQPHDCRPKCEY